jgi:hypothetical protein
MALTLTTTKAKQWVYRTQTKAVDALTARPWIRKWFGIDTHFLEVEYHISRLLFIHAYKLPESFSFATYICKGIDHEIVELMEIDVSSWVVLMGIITLNAARDHLAPELRDGETSNQSSHWMYLVFGWTLLLGFFLIYQRLGQCTGRLCQLGGCKVKPGTGAEQLADMCQALKRLHESDQHKDEALSLDQVKSELRDWEQANNIAAKHALKKELQRKSAQKSAQKVQGKIDSLKTVLSPKRLSFDKSKPGAGGGAVDAPVSPFSALSKLRKSKEGAGDGAFGVGDTPTETNGRFKMAAQKSFKMSRAVAALTEAKGAGATPENKQVAVLGRDTKWGPSPLQLMRVRQF